MLGICRKTRTLHIQTVAVLPCRCRFIIDVSHHFDVEGAYAVRHGGVDPVALGRAARAPEASDWQIDQTRTTKNGSIRNSKNRIGSVAARPRPAAHSRAPTKRPRSQRHRGRHRSRMRTAIARSMRRNQSSTSISPRHDGRRLPQARAQSQPFARPSRQYSQSQYLRFVDANCVSCERLYQRIMHSKDASSVRAARAEIAPTVH